MSDNDRASKRAFVQASRQLAGSPVPASIPDAFDHRHFSPNSYERKPRFISKADKAIWKELVSKIEHHVDWLDSDGLLALRQACLNVSPINCGWQEHAMANLVFWRVNERLAQGMAARSGETGTGSTVGNSPVGTADAPHPHSENNHDH